VLRSDCVVKEFQVENLRLNPEDRLVLVSDGFCEVAGGQKALNQLLNSFRNADAKDLLNELVFIVKRRFTDPEDMAEQDCSALVFDIDSKILRLHS
jgi:serine/threonine protein phosphatase PrpC